MHRKKDELKKKDDKKDVLFKVCSPLYFRKVLHLPHGSVSSRVLHVMSAWRVGVAILCFPVKSFSSRSIFEMVRESGISSIE